MFGKKKAAESQEDLDFELRAACRSGNTNEVRRLLAAGANVHTKNDDTLRMTAFLGDVETMKVLLEAGADPHLHEDWALRVAQGRGDIEPLRLIRDAIKKQDAQREKERLELERQPNPLLTGTGLTLAEFRPVDIENLLREAIAEQEQMHCPARAGAPGRDYVPLPQL